MLNITAFFPIVILQTIQSDACLHSVMLLRAPLVIQHDLKDMGRCVELVPEHNALYRKDESTCGFVTSGCAGTSPGDNDAIE